jgi:A/G-specific adenine glycosylase
MMNVKTIKTFKKIIWNYYREHGRSFVWRKAPYNPYHIVVSEIMLQQTQTYRVEPKFTAWIEALPTFKALAQAPLRDVLLLWQGLGYNRRAIALQKIAQKIVAEHDGNLPNSPELLVEFPGIGPATAASMCAFAFNRPTPFIETNIRAVFIHYFFEYKTDIKDTEIMPLVAASLDHNNAREWYYALMDYGVMLKKLHKNPSRKSAHHAKQSTFEGSHRQIRGMILKIMADHTALSIDDLINMIDRPCERTKKALVELLNEGFVKNNNNYISIY